MALIRPAVLAALIYFGYSATVPGGGGSSYRAFVLSLIAGGAVGLWVLKKILDLGEGTAKIVLEGLFLAGVAVFVGMTIPHRAGKTPLARWKENARPEARRALKRLGLDPDAPAAAKLLTLFPKP